MEECNKAVPVPSSPTWKLLPSHRRQRSTRIPEQRTCINHAAASRTSDGHRAVQLHCSKAAKDRDLRCEKSCISALYLNLSFFLTLREQLQVASHI